MKSGRTGDKTMNNKPSESVSEMLSTMLGDRMVNTDEKYGSNEECTHDELRQMCDELGWEYDEKALQPLSEYLKPETFVSHSAWQYQLRRFLSAEQVDSILTAYEADDD
jgi:hypothetical protein